VDKNGLFNRYMYFKELVDIFFTLPDIAKSKTKLYFQKMVIKWLCRVFLGRLSL
jgi:hypothetical protein